MSNKTGILAVIITAALLVCAMSGAVYYANTSSNNNGSSNTVDEYVKESSAKAPEIIQIEESTISAGAGSSEGNIIALPADIESFCAMIEEPEFADMTVYEVLKGQYYIDGNNAVMIDSAMAASSYLYGLGFFVIGDSLFAGNEDSSSDDQAKIDELRKQIEDVNAKVAAGAIDSEEAKKLIAELEAKIDSIKNAGSPSKTEVVDYAAVINDCTLKIKDLKCKLTGVAEADAEILNNIAELEAKIEDANKALEAQKASEIVEASVESESSVYGFNSITELTAAGFSAGSWATNSDMELAKIIEECQDMNIEKEIEKIAIEFTNNNNSIFTDYLMTLDDKALYEESLLEALFGTPFSINGKITNVTDAHSLAMYLYSNLGYAMVGTNMVVYMDEARFIDATEISPLAVMKSNFIRTMDTVNMGSDYAIHFVSYYLCNGVMSMDECIYRSDVLTALYEEYYSDKDVAPKNMLSIMYADSESTFVPAYMEFLGTPFCLDGVYMSVTDISSFEKYCASLNMAVGNGYIYVLMHNSSGITKIAIDQIDEDMMYDIFVMDFCDPYVADEYEFVSLSLFNFAGQNVAKGDVLTAANK